MKSKLNKGTSILIAAGAYGGFWFSNTNKHLHLCLGWIAFTLFLYDADMVLCENLAPKDPWDHSVLKAPVNTNILFVVQDEVMFGQRCRHNLKFEDHTMMDRCGTYDSYDAVSVVKWMEVPPR